MFDYFESALEKYWGLQVELQNASGHHSCKVFIPV